MYNEKYCFEVDVGGTTSKMDFNVDGTMLRQMKSWHKYRQQWRSYFRGKTFVSLLMIK